MTEANDLPESEAQPKSAAEKRAQTMIRRQKRNLRKATAEGFLAGVAAMLRPGDLAIDCGANVGVVTAVLAATGADVVCFEPDPYAFGELTKAFGDHPRVDLVNAAVGVGAGTVRLMRAANFEDNPASASVKSTILDGGRSIDGSQGIEVPLIDFPAWLAARVAERGQVAFIKLDIEGAELALLEELDRRDQLKDVRCLVAETHERKFRDLRERYRDLRATLGKKYPKSRVNLDWI
ncbi:MAG: FkbM family methyltransferase [Rhodobacteraceae bacterium]|nr:FkbM family methyltransferase [Paracoccaceae bacterium]